MSTNTFPSHSFSFSALPPHSSSPSSSSFPLTLLFLPPSSPLVPYPTRMFWRVVGHMNNTQRQQLLYFATGSATLPVACDTPDRVPGELLLCRQ